MLAYGLALAALCVLGERSGVDVGPLENIPGLVRHSTDASRRTLNADGEAAATASGSGSGAGVAGRALEAPGGGGGGAAHVQRVSLEDRDLPPAAFQNAPRPKAPLEGLDDPTAASPSPARAATTVSAARSR